MAERPVVIAGRYRVISILGKGGMGVAYRAWDAVAGVPVVVKMPLANEGNTDEAYERFRREARGMAALRHAHIVPVLDEGVDESGVPFIVIRFLPGGSLADRMPRSEQGARPSHPSTLHQWLPSIAAALDFMHSKGVVHRDVKPANIFFDARNNAFLGDFGIAKVFGEEGGAKKDLTLTATNVAIGTQAYMAPELLQPKPMLGGPADQYGLAVSVYEVLAGVRPFTGESAHIVVEQLSLPPPPLKSHQPKLPSGLCDAVHRGLAKAPRERFATCLDFAEAVLQGIPRPDRKDGAAWLMCPLCRRILKLREDIAGKVGKCTRCSAMVRVARDLESVWLTGEDDVASGSADPNSIPLWSETSRKKEITAREGPARGEIRSAGRARASWWYVVATALCATVAAIMVGRANLWPGVPPSPRPRPTNTKTTEPSPAPAPEPDPGKKTVASNPDDPVDPPPPRSSVALRKQSRAGRWGQLRTSLWNGDGIAVKDYLYEGDMTGLVDIPIEVSAAGRTRYGIHGAECAAVIKSDGSVYEIRNTPGLDESELRKKWDAPRAEGAAQVFSTSRGFAALLENGAVVSWSNGSPYGTFEDVADGLKANVLGVAGTDDSFAAIKRDGSVITWGGRAAASDSRRVASALSSDVVRVFSSGKEFAALKRDGSVVSWGYLTPPRDPSDEPLDGIIEVFGNEGAFAGLKEDGSVVMFGPAASYTASYVESLKSLGTFGKARWIYTTRYHFAALVDTGRVVTWGRDGIADNVPPAASEGVFHIVANDEAFAAIKADGSVVTWRPGRRNTNPGVVANTIGGDSSAVSEKLRRGVEIVVATKTAFAALMTDGSVVTWGGGPEGDGGGDSRVVAEELRGGVVDIVANQFAFAAIKNNGGVVCWGKDSAKKFSAGFVRQALVENDGRWSIAEDEQRILSKMLSAGCVDIATTDDAFVAMTETGAVIPWGGRRSQKETFDSQLVAEKTRIAASGVAHLATPLSSGVLVGAPVAGIAIAHNAASEDVHGVWEYRPQASRNWRPIPRDVSNASAMALGTTARIRFRPNAGFYGTPGGLMMTLLTDPSQVIRSGDRVNITETRVLGWLPISTTCPTFRPQDDVVNKDDGGMKGPSPLDTLLSATEKRGDDEINLFRPPAGKSRKGTGKFQNQASDAVGLIDEWGIAVSYFKLDPSGPSPPEGLVVLECLPLGRELGFSEGDSITRFDTDNATPRSLKRALEQDWGEDGITLSIRRLEARFKLPTGPYSPWEISRKLPAASEGYRAAEKLVIKRMNGPNGPVAAAVPQTRQGPTYLFRYGNWKGEWKPRPQAGVFDCTMTDQAVGCTATYVATVRINGSLAQLTRTQFVHSVNGPEPDRVFEGELTAGGKKITWTKFGYVTLVE